MIAERIRNNIDLEKALQLVARYKRLTEKYKKLFEQHTEKVIHYLEFKNMKSFTTEDGDTWQKRQGTHIVYQFDELRRLLRHKRIDPDTIIKQVVTTTEEIDTEALVKLLKGKVITVEEYESIAVRNTNKPYLAYRARKKKQPKTAITLGLRRRNQS
jgi:hypothetical protein